MNRLPAVPASKVIDTQLDDAISVISSIADLSKGQAIGIGLRVFRNLISGNFWQGLRDEWEILRTKKIIQDDYELKAEDIETLGEILDYLEKPNPSKEILNILKKLFLIQVSLCNVSNEVLHREFVKTTKLLDSNEALFLKFLFENFRSNNPDKNSIQKSSTEFYSFIKERGFKYRYIIDNLFEKLNKLGLLKKPDYLSNEYTRFFFTEYGMAYLEYIENYDNLLKK
jgi:hypothetical protein